MLDRTAHGHVTSSRPWATPITAGVRRSRFVELLLRPLPYRFVLLLTRTTRLVIGLTVAVMATGLVFQLAWQLVFSPAHFDAFLWWLDHAALVATPCAAIGIAAATVADRKLFRRWVRPQETC